MALGLLAQTIHFVGYQIPLFLLVFGGIFIVMGFVLKPLKVELALPIGTLAVALSLAWFVAMGGIAFLTMEIWAVVGIGIVAMIVGRTFAGV